MEDYGYDKDEIKNNMIIEQVLELVAELGGEPHMTNDETFVSKTICHNLPGEGSHKLYYYDNTKLFRCYTSCDSTFDIFELVAKVNNNIENFKPCTVDIGDGPQQSVREWNLYDGIVYVAEFLGITPQHKEAERHLLADWKIMNRYEKTNSLEIRNQRAELKIHNPDTLKFYPKPRITQWENEGMDTKVLRQRGIAYNPITEAILIPHYDINGDLIGIRERTLIKDNEKFGKYIPSIIGGMMYNHPLSFNLYNINNVKDNVSMIKKAIIFESEKSCLLYASYFGSENDISVAICGSSLVSFQVSLLLSLGVEEIVIALDKQFQSMGDKEWQRLTKNLTNIHTKFGAFVQVSYLFDKEDLLGYKDSPIDCGKENFLTLFANRIYI